MITFVLNRAPQLHYGDEIGGTEESQLSSWETSIVVLVGDITV